MDLRVGGVVIGMPHVGVVAIAGHGADDGRGICDKGTLITAIWSHSLGDGNPDDMRQGTDESLKILKGIELS